MRNCCLSRSLLPLVCATSLLSGCASFGGAVDDLFGPEPAIAQKGEQLPEDALSFVVELQPNNKSPEIHKFPIADKPTYIAKVVEKSRAVKRFGRIDIELWRQLPDGAGHHKVNVPYDRKQRAIPPGYDYAIRAGDRLVIIEDTSGVLDDMLDAVTSPLAAIR